MPRYAQGGPDWVEITGAVTFADGSTAAPNWTDLATDAERAAAGVAAIVDAEISPPAGQVHAGWAEVLQDVDGVPTRVPVYAAVPRRTIAKSLVHARVDAVGKLGAAFAALQANPTYFGRWFAPDWPRVYADDAGLLAVLADVGCTPDQIAVITAA